MIFGMTFYQICWYFIVYSFLGWVLEVAYHAVTLGKVINRGFLNGPVCPVYGFGAVSVFALINSIQTDGKQMNAILVFIFGVILAKLVELIAGWLLDVCFHARWWDYSDKPFNLHGYICLEFSIIWGLTIVFVVRVLHSAVNDITVDKIDPKIGWILIAVMGAAYVADLVVTVLVIQGFNKKLSRLDQMQKDMRSFSDKLSEFVGQRTIETQKRLEEGHVQAALARAELKDAAYEDLLKRREETEKNYEVLKKKLLAHHAFGQGRILQAFPNMKHRNYQHIVDMLQNREQ